MKEENTPTLFVVIKALPKEALIEKQVFLHTGRCSITSEDYTSMQLREPIFEQGLVSVIGCIELTLIEVDRSFRPCRWSSIAVADVTLPR